jgi:uncharacterized membrane protein YhhN
VTPILVASIVMGAAVAGHLAAEAVGAATARGILKAVASASFLAVAALSSAGGRTAHLVVAGLWLSAAGDVLLLGKGRRAFLAGIGAFLLAHVAYAAAFAPASRVSPWTGVVLASFAALLVRWLWPHLGAFRVPVVVYAVAITIMLFLALGVANPLVRAGAALFYVSDLTVARDRFVRPGFENRVVGLPLYYAGQLLLALSTHAPPG